VLIAVAVAAGTLVACSDTTDDGPVAFAVEDATLGSPERVRLSTAEPRPEDLAPQGEAPEAEEPNEELPRTPSDPRGSPFVSTAFPATELKPFSGNVAGFPLRFKTTVDQGHTASTAEPHVASNGSRVMIVWNKPSGSDGTEVGFPGGGAAFSSDGGRTFDSVDPETQFPEVHAGFCCDQHVLYSARNDLWIWILQYWDDAAGNVLRVAVARGNAGFDAREFTYWDFAPKDYAPTAAVAPQYGWFDYPNVGSSNEHLFVSANIFPLEGQPTKGVTATAVLRLPFAQLKKGDGLDYRYYRRVRPEGPDNGSYLTPVFAEGASATMYFAQHSTETQLSVGKWPDKDDDPTFSLVAHSRHRHFYSSPRGPYTCPRTAAGDYPSNWCDASDDRLYAGWMAKGVIGFAWGARQDPENGFPYPFVMAVEIDEKTMKRKSEPAIWSPNHAYQYAALAPNARGEIGGVVLAGGGDQYLTCAALVRDPSRPKTPWKAGIIDASDSDLPEERAGDYLGAVRSSARSSTWVGSCMTQAGGTEWQRTKVVFASFGS
jgi:hypothetical protein